MRLETADLLDTPETHTLGEINSFLQSPLWAHFKADHGWHKHFFTFFWNENKCFISALVRKLSYFGSFVYVPLGPHISIATADERQEILTVLGSALKNYFPRNTMCIRFDPPWETIQNTPNNFWTKPLCKAISDIQPPDTVMLPITQDEESILDAMKSKWRYNIKLAQKKGVIVRFLTGEQASKEGIDIFYDLYIDTSKRDRIAVHAKSYYTSLVLKIPAVRVYIAEHEGKPLASIITIFYGNCATYVYGASSNEKRNLMPAYLLQWSAILDAKKSGCLYYDFYGIPPEDNPAHPMHGLYRFKTGFGGTIVHRVGSIDYVIKNTSYTVYRWAEFLRNIWYKKVKKLLAKFK